MSAATSLYTTLQQLALTLGIGVSAAALSLSIALTGHDRPMPSDFSAAYLFVACIAIFAPLVSTSLHPNAGAELSGHPNQPVVQPKPSSLLARLLAGR
jgi:hypothetical protein